ncbi:MAG: MBL fold metallo-hydrolase [Nitrososphaerota archaeon]|nr:MBL fold metallo-hydrolase [Nitrososphaerota archaeon]
MEAICSEETFLLSTLRGIGLKRAENHFPLLDSGHMLGSKAILLETGDGTILYTGDINTSPLGGISRQRFPRVNVLIIESNYGCPNLVFPPKHELIKEVVDYLKENLSKNRPVVLMGYPLGKSQHIQMILDGFLPEVEKYASASIVRYNDVYRLFSFRIEEKKILYSQSQALPKGYNWILYYPNISGRNAFMQVLKKKYSAVLIGFSGRSLIYGYEESLGVDKAFPLSDHADFKGLLKIVEETSPQKVLTIHGFSTEFSRELRKLGYDAYDLNSMKGKCITLF